MYDEEHMIYKKMYLKLFNIVTDAVDIIKENPLKAKELLENAQRECEEIYIANGEI